MNSKLRELFLYGAFGLLTTFINIIIFAVLTERLEINYLLANIVAWILSVVFAFVTNKQFVFNSKSWRKQVWTKECITFFSARLATGAIDLILMFSLVSQIYIDEVISKIIANIVVIVSNYILSKLLIFKGDCK